MASSPSQRALLGVGFGLLLGLVVWYRDWVVLLTASRFYTENYYELYWRAYTLSYPVAAAALLVTGLPCIHFWVAFVLPSFLVRHAQFLWEVGPTNTWPPALFLDAGFTLPVLLCCWLVVWSRSTAITKMRTTKP